MWWASLYGVHNQNTQVIIYWVVVVDDDSNHGGGDKGVFIFFLLKDILLRDVTEIATSKNSLFYNELG